MSPSIGDDIKFHSEVSDLDSDFMMQWNIESCFGTGNIILSILSIFFKINDFQIIGIDLEINDTSPPLSPSSSDSAPSGDSQSSFDSNQVSIYFVIIF